MNQCCIIVKSTLGNNWNDHLVAILSHPQCVKNDKYNHRSTTTHHSCWGKDQWFQQAWYCAFSISHSHLSSKNSQKATPSSHFRVRYGCFLWVKSLNNVLDSLLPWYFLYHVIFDCNIVRVSSSTIVFLYYFRHQFDFGPVDAYLQVTLPFNFKSIIW